MSTRCRSFLLVALTLIVASDALLHAQTFTGRVVGVSDGDTISAMREGRSVRVRLDGIDAPANGQDFANRAKRFTSALVFGETVTINVKDTDRYGRLVARVIAGGQDGSVRLTLRAAQCRDGSSSIPLSEAPLSAGHH
jgi:micrococcal nuclease